MDKLMELKTSGLLTKTLENAPSKSQTAEELAKLYEVYFTPTNDSEQAPSIMFEQVSLFDYSLASYTTDSVCLNKVSYA